MPSLPELLALPYGQSSSGTSSLEELLASPYDGSSPYSQGPTADEYRARVRQYGERLRWLRAIEGTQGPSGETPTKSGKFFVEVPLDPAVRVFLSQNRRDNPSEEFAQLATGQTTISFLPDELDPIRDDRFVALDRSLTDRTSFMPSGAAFDALPHKSVLSILAVFAPHQQLLPARYHPSSRGIEWTGAPPTQPLTVLYTYRPHFEWLGDDVRQGPLDTSGARLPTTGTLRLLSAREE